MIIDFIGKDDASLVSPEQKCQIIEELLREHKMDFIKYYSYAENREIHYKGPREYNQEGEFISYEFNCSPHVYNFIYYLFSTRLNELTYIMSKLMKGQKEWTE